MATAAPQVPPAGHRDGVVDEPVDAELPRHDDGNDNDDDVAHSDDEGDAEEEGDERWADERDDEAAAVDVGVLIEAMDKCVAFYHQANKMAFYAMVAEEYGTLLPDSDEVSVETIEQMELSLQQIATELMSDADDSSDVDLPRDVEPHVEALVAFYKTLGSFDAIGKEDDAAQRVNGAREEEEEDALPHESVQSPAGQTDGSASNPTTPLGERAEEDFTTAAAATAENVTLGRSAQPSELHAPPSSELTAAATTATNKSTTSPQHSQVTYDHAKTTLFDLTKAHVESKQRLNEQEELLKSEKLRTEQKKREYKALKAIVKQYRQRDQERKRIRLLLDDDDDARDSDDSGSDGERPSLREMRKLYRKETKRLRRLQENLSLKFQLLQSEHERHKMKTEQQMAELRNEYTDSYVFGP